MQPQFAELNDSQWEFIKNFLAGHKPKKLCLRQVFNAILYVCRTGVQWRNLRFEGLKWGSVYYYFSIWKKNGLWIQMLDALVIIERKRHGREARPSAVAIDSQSVKGGAWVPNDTKGIDGGKKVNGRKRHLVVDTQGLPIAIFVSPANMHDGVGGLDLLWRIEPKSERLELIRADNTYNGMFTEMAESIYAFRVETRQRPPSEKGFVPENGRWPVEQAFGWLNFFRRLAKDYEYTIQSAEAFLHIAFISVSVPPTPS